MSRTVAFQHFVVLVVFFFHILNSEKTSRDAPKGTFRQAAVQLQRSLVLWLQNNELHRSIFTEVCPLWFIGLNQGPITMLLRWRWALKHT